MTRTFRFHAALAPSMLALAALWLPAGGALAQALDRRAFVNSEIPPQIKAVPGTPRTGR